MTSRARRLRAGAGLEAGGDGAALADGPDSSSSSISSSSSSSSSPAEQPASFVAGFAGALARRGDPAEALESARALHAELAAKAEAAAAKAGEGLSAHAAAERASAVLFRQLYRHHSRFMAASMSGGRLDLALAYVELLPAKSRTWSMLLGAALDAARNGGLQQPLATVRQIVEARTGAGIPEDAWTATALITAARLQGDLEAAELMFERSWGKGAGFQCTALGTAMLNVLAARGDAAGAAELVASMRDAGAPMDQAAYGAYLQALEAGNDLELVERVLDEMSEDGIRLSAWLAMTAMKTACACGQRTPDWFFGIYKQSMDSNSDRDRGASEFVLSQLFASLAACPQVQQVDVEAAFDIFTAYRNARRTSGKPIHDAVYTSILSLFSKQGDPFRVVDIWDDIVEDGAQRRPAIVCAVLSCCAASARPDMLAQAAATQVFAVQDLAWELYDATLAAPGWPRSSQIMQGTAAQTESFVREISQSGSEQEAAVSSASSPCRPARGELLTSFNALLNYCARSGAVEEALEILALMRGPAGPAAETTAPHHGPVPDTTSFNTVMAGLASTGRHARANFVLAEMRSAGLEPDEITFSTLIHACTEANNCKAAEEVILSMPEYGLQPTVTAYTAYMDACLKDGSNARVSQVFDILKNMKAKGVAATPITYIMVLRACVAQRDADKAFDMYRRAAEENLLLNDSCHNLLIKVCTVTGRLDDGVELVKQVARNHGGIKGHTFNALIRAIAGVSVDRALRLLGLMRAMGLKPSTATVLDLVDACTRDNNAQAAFALYRGLQNSHHAMPRSTGSGLVLGLCAAGEKENAMQVFNGMMAAGGHASPADSSADKLKAINRDAPQEQASPRRRLRYHFLPTPVARSRVAYMLAQTGDFQGALAVVKTMKADEGTSGMSEAAAANKEMFQELITGFCRQGCIDDALYVFDEWKGSVVFLPEERRVGCMLNSAVLAFLEASCRNQKKHQWRVFDVTAVMRQQFETGKQSRLERPQKESHHFNSSAIED